MTLEESIRLMSLGDRVSTARVVLYDFDRHLALVWRDGHGIHAYNADGDEVSRWRVGPFDQEDANEIEVRASMLRHISGEVDYP